MEKETEPKRKHAPKNHAAAVIRRNKIVAAALAGKSIKQAAIDAGISPRTAGSQASNILKHCEVQGAFQESLNRTIPDKVLSDKYDEIMSASRVIHYDPETKETATAPDYPTQLRAADSVAKLKGHMIEKKEVSGPEGGPIRMTEVTDEELLNLARRGGRDI
jgi:phage terminase small subunit